MRRFVMWCAALVLYTSPAAAHEFTVEIDSSYIDAETFNDRFSNDLVAKFEGTIELGHDFYVDGYVYSGFTDPLNDESSEYGLEVGWEREVAPNTLLNVAVGRWANYNGDGFDAGDTFLRVGVTHNNLTVSATALAGVTDDVIVNVSYMLPIGERLTVTPSVAVYVDGEAVYPAVLADYSVTDTVSVRAYAVLPEDENGTRQFYAAVGLALTF